MNLTDTPKPLTLTGVEIAPDVVTFIAGSKFTLTLPRPAWIRISLPLPRLVGMPVRLTVFGAAPERGSAQPSPEHFRASFDIYPETPGGGACLAALEWADRVGPPDGEE